MTLTRLTVRSPDQESRRILVALDVGYQFSGNTESGRCGVVAFESWTTDTSLVELSVDTKGVTPYISGRLFERELPCLLAGLDALNQALPKSVPVALLVDGNVRLDNAGQPGLGMHLYMELKEAVPIIGVAKSSFKGLDAIEVNRGTSSNPLHVTSVGIAEDDAALHVQSMAGPFRLPTLIQRADSLSRRAP